MILPPLAIDDANELDIELEDFLHSNPHIGSVDHLARRVSPRCVRAEEYLSHGSSEEEPLFFCQLHHLSRGCKREAYRGKGENTTGVLDTTGRGGIRNKVSVFFIDLG